VAAHRSSTYVAQNQDPGSHILTQLPLTPTPVLTTLDRLAAITFLPLNSLVLTLLPQLLLACSSSTFALSTMPVKVIIVGAIATFAVVGFVAYENREWINEKTEPYRRKLVAVSQPARRKVGELLHYLADKVTPPEHHRPDEVPLAGRPFPSPPPRRGSSPFDEGGTSSGMAERSVGGGLRQRGADVAKSEVLFESASVAVNSDGKPVGVATPWSRRSSTATATNVLPTDQEHVESGYESHPSPAPQEHASLASLASSRTISEVADNAPVHQNQNPFGGSPLHWSIHEWAENTTHHTGDEDRASSPSLAGSGLDDFADVNSEPGSLGSWSEVASEFSDDHMH
jgi:hypothetical protein